MTTHSPTRKQIAVVLSGCGNLDGSEITEAVSVLIALSEAGVDAHCFAPNAEFPTAAFLGHEQPPRNAMTEAARIARSRIKDLSELHESDFEAVVFPGGMGAAQNLSNWATEGSRFKVHPEVRRIIKEFHKVVKPIGAICIAPTLIARILGSEGVNITLGADSTAATEVEKTGAHHVKCAVDDYVSDRDHKVLTSPAYMHADAKPHEVFAGIRKLIRELVEMA